MLPMLEREVVKRYQWASMEELLDYFAIGQCTPGIIAVNTATFIGFRRRGVVGGIVATLGIIAPSILIIGLISSLLSGFMEYEVVAHAFVGIRIAVCALILNTILKLAKTSVKTLWQAILALLAFAIVAFLKVNTIIVIAATIVGAMLRHILCKQGGENKQ